MYGHSNKKTHGTVENCERIDSFEAMRCDPNRWDTGISAGEAVWLDCVRKEIYFGGEVEEVIELSHPDSVWSQELSLTRVYSGFGGTRAYWLCPTCGERFRYLYFRKKRFICRKCAELNYKSQQETKNSFRHVRKGLKLAEERLDWFSWKPIAPIQFAGLSPIKPKGMHWSTYRKYRERLRKYQDQYEKEAIQELTRGLSRFKKYL